ncbi:uncharacterized protein LOC143453047 [Clavelina lepadiformis]|uniref:uncharacterized protein LOC143453047 n=1 Tax=Clavelina lepadiformis TaxID=159417 RepID=UPI0040410942
MAKQYSTNASHEVVNIIKEDKGKVSLDEKVLQSVLGNPEVSDLPVALYSIAGPFRTGKSLLLNLFARYLEKKTLDQNDDEKITGPFKFKGGASNRCTDGIWITCKPHIISTKKDKKVALFLMDTQGSFDLESSTEDSAILFALSLLFSSYQFFNLQDKIYSFYLQALCKFSEYASNVKGTRSASPFQDLMFLVRDWEKEDHAHGIEGGSSYLKTVLKDRGAQEHIDTKSLLEETFSYISCFLWPPPGQYIKRMGEKATACTLKDIDEEFLKIASSFFEYFSEEKGIHLKKIDNEQVTCEDLLKFGILLADVINKECVDSVESYMEAGKAAKMELLIHRCVNIYKEFLKEFGKESLKNRHENGEMKAIEEFENQSKDYNEVLKKNGETKLQKELSDIYVLEQNIEKNKRLLEECVDIYRSGMEKNFMNIKNFFDTHSDVIKQAETHLQSKHVWINDHSLEEAMENLQKKVSLLYKTIKPQVDYRHLSELAKQVANKWREKFGKLHFETFEERRSQAQQQLLEEFKNAAVGVDDNLLDEAKDDLKSKISNKVQKYLKEILPQIVDEEIKKHKDQLTGASRFTTPTSLKRKQEDLLEDTRKRARADLDLHRGRETNVSVKTESDSTFISVLERNQKFQKHLGLGLASISGVSLVAGIAVLPAPVSIALGLGGVGLGVMYKSRASNYEL